MNSILKLLSCVLLLCAAELCAQTVYPLAQQSPSAWPNVTFASIRGYRFQCNANNLSVTQLGCWYPDSNTTAKTLTLFNFNTQALLGQVTITPGTGWCWASLSTPVALTNGQQYVVTGYSPTGHYYNNTVPASWMPSGDIQYLDMRYLNSPTSPNQFPSGGYLTTSHHGVVDIGYTNNSSQPPTITSTAPTQALVGSPYSYTPSATGNPTPSFNITPDPATLGSGWLTWNGTTLSGTPQAGDIGSYGPFTLTATNGVSPDDTEVFTINVAQPFAQIDIDDPNAAAVTSGAGYTIYAAQAGVASTGNFLVSNNGNVDLTFTNTPVVTESALVNCTLNTTNPAGPITPGSSSTLGVSVTPAAAGNFSFTLTIDNNDSDEGSFVIHFSGVAKATAEAEIAVLNSASANVADGSTISETNTGTAQFSRGFTIRNEGGAALNLTGTTPVMVSGESNCSVVITQPANSLLAASTWNPTTEAFSLAITPGAAGAFSFTITITNNDTDEGGYSFTYSGHTATPGPGIGIGIGGGGGGGGGGCTGGTPTAPWLLLALAALAATAVLRRRTA